MTNTVPVYLEPGIFLMKNTFNELKFQLFHSKFLQGTSKGQSILINGLLIKLINTIEC